MARSFLQTGAADTASGADLPTYRHYGLDKEEALAAVKNFFLEDNDMDYCVILEEEGEESPYIQAMSRGEYLNNWTIRTTKARRASG